MGPSESSNPRELLINYKRGDAVDIQTVPVDLILKRLLAVPDPSHFLTARPRLLTDERTDTKLTRTFGPSAYFLATVSCLLVCTCLNGPARQTPAIGWGRILPAVNNLEDLFFTARKRGSDGEREGENPLKIVGSSSYRNLGVKRPSIHQSQPCF